MKAAVLTAGSWGTALAAVLAGNGHQVSLWARDAQQVAAMRASRRNERYLPGHMLPAGLEPTADLAEAVCGADLVLVSTPSQYIRLSFRALAELGWQGPVVDVSKGIENSSLLRISEICAQELPGRPYAVLAGPSHAEEVIAGIPTVLVSASADEATAIFVQQAFMNAVLRVYTSSDVTGVELGGALKNIFAIAAGIIDGLGGGDNTKAALMTRGIVEMSRLGEALGGRRETFNGLSGIGDLIVTCTSRHSRNRRVGEMLGRGLSMAEIQTQLGHQVAEGLRTTLSAYELAGRLGVSVPIIDQCHAVIHRGENVKKALACLMGREAKTEI